MMRQAGRYDPEYRALREKYSMLELCRTPELALQVTLQPMKLGVDAAILFADILLPLEPMGAPFSFEKGEGPVVHAPVRSHEDVAKLRVIDPQEGLGYIAQSIKLLKKELPVPLIGFAGAPFTLASYLVEGGKSRDFQKTKKLMYGSPDTWKLLMEKLAEVTRKYLHMQIDAGADAVQLFDSWVGQLDEADYIEYVQPHVRGVLKDVEKRGVPVIHFGVGTQALIPAMKDAGARRSARPGRRRSATIAACRATWTRRCSSRRARSPASTRSACSIRPRIATATSSISDTASCPRRRSTP
jgi:uroporphyrinogen decarboxylase